MIHTTTAADIPCGRAALRRKKRKGEISARLNLTRSLFVLGSLGPFPWGPYEPLRRCHMGSVLRFYHSNACTVVVL
jgi:hypothetical protein